MADHTHSTKHLDSIFYPQSIAVLGTTNVSGTVPHDIFENLLIGGYTGILYPVSPGSKSIQCVKAFKYVLDIEDSVEMAVIVFPSHVCNLALEQCGQKGIHAAIIISAGFKETGPKGLAREQQLQEIARKYDITLIGPNCLGVINTDPEVMLNASFARKMPEAGNIAFLSQSGALCTAVLDYAQSKHIGFSKFVSFGNKADVTEIDLLYYLKDDPKTQVILLYLEEITDGTGLMRAAEEVIAETGKPILLLKSGRTQEGASAAASHTGSMAGSDEICDAAMKQCGIIRCSTIEEMFNFAIAMAYQPLPQGNRVAIITNAGGPGVLATDAAVMNRLQVARFTDETTQKLKEYLPKTANIKNPVDVIGDARRDRYQVAISSTLQDPNVDGALVILTPQSMTDIEAIASEVCNHAAESDKPLLTSFMGEADVAKGIDILLRHKIPHYILPETMCSAFACAYRFKRTREREPDSPVNPNGTDSGKAQAVLDRARAAGRRMLSARESEELAQAYGIPIVESRLAQSEAEAARAAEAAGFPVVMKIASEDIVHKVNLQGVVLNIRTAAEAADAYRRIMQHVQREMPEARVEGVMIQRMITGAQEVILGIKRDPSFGAVVMFGYGGIYVEVFHDVIFRVAPLGKRTIQSMIQEIKAYPILAGIRGQKAGDIAALEDCLARLSRLAVDCPQIQEMDINPLFVLEPGKGCCACDIKVMV